MNWKRPVAGLLVAAVALGTAYVPQVRMDRQRQSKFDDELLYLPNEKLLNHLTCGMSSVVADILWLRCIQYTSKHFKGDHKFTWLAHMGNTITRLDPNFVDAYRYTGVFLAGLKADDMASAELMKRGFLENPDAWELPYEIAMVYLLNRRDEPGSAEMAARYLAMAVATERAPESVLAIAQGLQRKHNLVDIERQLWQDMLQSSRDQFRRDMAERKLQELDIRENVAALDRVVAHFEAARKRKPASLEELVQPGGLDRIPADPLGGRYFLDEDGKVQNTTLLDSAVERRMEVIRDQIAKFQRQCGRLPVSLQEMVDMKVVKAIPGHPYKDRDWSYNPQTGEVSQ